VHLLVTGGAGFIGSNFVRYWVDAHPGDTVVVYDALTYAGNLENLSGLEDRVPLVHGDICNLDLATRTLRHHGIDTVVNFAAESHNSLAVLDPGLFFRTNVLGTQTMLEASRNAGIARFHHISTCEVYGDLDLDSDEAFTESSPYRPRTPYNASKAGADHAVRAYFETYGLPVTITNCANNYGPFQFPEKVIPLFATRALDGLNLPLYASTSNRREWIHVLDHCRAIDAVLAKGEVGETYHVGTGVEASIDEVADRILEILGLPESLKTIVPDRPGHDRRYLLDAGRIQLELGWEPTIEWAAGLADTVRWYADHRSWWEPLRDRAPVVESAWLPTPGAPPGGTATPAAPPAAPSARPPGGQAASPLPPSGQAAPPAGQAAPPPAPSAWPSAGQAASPVAAT
jgi:dTDP-glucose 4,6-dehydratase